MNGLSIEGLINTIMGHLLLQAREGAREGGYRPPPGALPDSFARALNQVGRAFDLDPALLAAVAKAESNFNSAAISHAGAKGLMQLMDGTARSMGVQDVWDPLQNLVGGARFLRGLLDRYRSLPLALPAYNAGPGAVDRYRGIPPYAETNLYVGRVLDLYRAYARIAPGVAGEVYARAAPPVANEADA